jgi:hypothetical protein
MTTIIPMYIIITKPNENKYEIENFILADINQCFNKLITILLKYFEKKIDYPDTLEEFTNLYWYQHNIMNNEIFYYNIYENGVWKQPWSNDELYQHMIDIIYNKDIQNSIFNKKNYKDYESDEEEIIDNNKQSENDDLQEIFG